MSNDSEYTGTRAPTLKYNQFPWKCWSTLALFCIGLSSFAIYIIYKILWDRTTPGIGGMIILRMSCLCITLCAVRLLLKMALAGFVVLPWSVVCEWMGTKTLPWFLSISSFKLWPVTRGGVLCLGYAACIYLLADAWGVFFVLVVFSWILFVIWSWLPPDWKSGAEVLVFGKEIQWSQSSLVNEGLVFLLIVLVISVIKPVASNHITKFLYTTEGMPSIGNLRTLLAMYRSEKDHLPGLAKPVDRTTATNGSMIRGVNGSASRLQTWRAVETNINGIVYHPAVWDFAQGRSVDVANRADHYTEDLEIDSDYSGSSLCPKVLFYRSDGAGAANGAYLCVFGVFGDGQSIKKGTGYAVMELRNPTLLRKITATWQRFKPVKRKPSQIIMLNQAELEAHTSIRWENARSLWNEDICWIGQTDLLLGDDETAFKETLENLRAAGWEF